MTEWTAKIVARLHEMQDIHAVWAFAEHVHAYGDVALTADFGIALTEAFRPGGRQPWPYRCVFDHVLRLVAATPGRAGVVQALRLVRAPEVAGRALDRSTAALLAFQQPPEHLAAAFTGHASEELRACLVHELVLRDVQLSRIPAAEAWATSRHWRYHPLGRLPLTRSDLETDGDRPPAGGDARTRARTRTPQVPHASETTTEAVARSIGTAARNWTEGSNGRVEAREFLLDQPLAEDAIPGALRSLGLHCLAGDGRKGRPALSVTPVHPAYAWRALFGAACSGGAYNSGVQGAYGRLEAWQSLGALAGAEEGAEFADLEGCVRACAWYGFESDAPWFEQVAWDFGLAAVTDDRHRLAVLAATDTD
ncbi:DUF6183 family protein [Streptomyces cavernicola]|uniref:DUF6183 family protein n=1 Tax=Streptomyces cavernicola TaxID=3043613 RepID=A0ABT6S720_9ACTN|nr:DUF6183 family protein [Streptomyces sp. B-S-A6]MDI3403870.1 DUF6183 family protein [Streptomyces sp. B-S-A6]